MRTITLEEHVLTQTYIDATGAYDGPWLPMREKLLDIGAGRIAAMDEAGIDLQVLSAAGMGFDALDADTATTVAASVNDELAAGVRAFPARFRAFASLGMKDPARAAKELDRAVTKLGFPGAMISGTISTPLTGETTFLDSPRYTPVLEAAAHLGVPIYLHPAQPPGAVFDAYFTGLPGDTGHLLSIAGWGWHSETAIHTLRLITSGVFDRLPNLQIIIGHMGEMLPFALARSSAVLSRAAKLQRPVADYFRTNIAITTSGYFTLPPLQCAMAVVGLDRMMFSVDYPFSPNTNGRTFLTEAAAVLSAEQLEAFTHRNAERFLRLA